MPANSPTTQSPTHSTKTLLAICRGAQAGGANPQRLPSMVTERMV